MQHKWGKEECKLYFGGKPEGKRPLGRKICRWVDNIKKDFKRDRMGWYGLD
jgi:hypothetical protein